MMYTICVYMVEDVMYCKLFTHLKTRVLDNCTSSLLTLSYCMLSTRLTFDNCIAMSEWKVACRVKSSRV